MTAPSDSQPGRPYRYVRDGFWPDFSEDDPVAHRRHQAWQEIAVTEPQHRPAGVRRLLTITCSHQHHDRATGRAPRLAEVWYTDNGRLYIARIPHRRVSQVDRRRTAPPPPQEWDPIPFTEVVWFVDDPAQGVLPCACPNHGGLCVSRVTLVAHLDAMTAIPMGGGSVQIHQVAHRDGAPPEQERNPRL